MLIISFVILVIVVIEPGTAPGADSRRPFLLQNLRASESAPFATPASVLAASSVGEPRRARGAAFAESASRLLLQQLLQPALQHRGVTE